MTILVWHRRDLRLADNPALAAAVAQDASIVPVFILDPTILQRPDTAAIRVQFLLDSLQVLAQKYQAIGGKLILRLGDPLQVLQELVQECQARAVFFNGDIEPFARERDAKVLELLQPRGVTVESFQEIMLHEPGAVLSQQGKIYSVYGPYWRNWFTHPKLHPFAAPEHISTPELPSQPIPTLAELGLATDQPAVSAGEDVALALLDDFCDPYLIFSYNTQRNFPAVDGTSQLSPHLRMGTIGIRTVWERTVELEADAHSEESLANLRVWQQELAWREFYKYTLYHFPYIETEPYQRKFTNLIFDDNRERFEQWCRGETGYPLVDAAMQQLNQTGWMHNRCRMVVASFLTKDLLLDWRWGEQYFMQKLVDGDLAANNGGWQWSASIGTDAKPLRIFNPQTQLARFDPEGSYVRRWLPQLASAEPQELITAKNLHRYGYARPIVDHKYQQEVFKQRYNSARV